MNGYGGNYYRNQRYDRIDQDEVPESKHTVFIRGLPGHLKTDEVKDFFEDHVGPCSFDFIKLSPDQLKLFVAVRFETRDAAKECMHKYKDGEVLGYPVEISWFKDIRRYVSYQQSQGLRPATVPRNRYNNRSNYSSRASYERSSRGDYRDDEYDRGSKRKRTSSRERRSPSKRSRTRSNSSSRSRSHTPRRSSRERSHSAGSRRSDGSPRVRSRSRSHASSASPRPPPRDRTASPPNGPSPPAKRLADVIEKGSTPPLPPTPAPASAVVLKQSPSEKSATRKSPSVSRSPSPPVVEQRKSKKSKKEKKKRRKRSRSSSSSTNSAPERSSEELSEGELRKKILKKRQKQQIYDETNEPSGQTNGKTLGKWEEKELPSNTSSIARPESSLQNITLKFGLESSEEIPRQIIREVPSPPKKASILSTVPTVPSPTLPALAAVKLESAQKDVRLTPPPVPPRFSKGETVTAESIPSYKQSSGVLEEKKREPEMGKAEATSSSSYFSTDIDSLLGKRSNTNQSSMLDDIKGGVYSSARGQPATVSLRSILDDSDEPIQSAGSLRLSSLTRQITAESERDRKLSRLPPELLAKFVAKKKQFDAALKADCETFAFVTKTLIQKDPGLEGRLRSALDDAVRDIEESFTGKIDQFLDQLIMFMSM